MKHGARILTRTLTIVSLVCLLLAPAQARSVKQKKLAARTQFETAERLREALNGKPERQRTRKDYDRALDAYRKVYHTAPNSTKADASVLAVAELLDEQGRVLHDPKNFKDAIGQLEFLRREYPGSKYRGEALFTMAEIYRDDLDDGAQAKTTFQEFLKRYPRSNMATRAQAALDDMDAYAAKEKTEGKNKPGKRQPERSAEATTAEARGAETRPDDKAVPQSHAPLLTSIRHWSTPDYTRVAIDLEQEVKYEAGRVPHPDRIFFDLHGTKLAPGLAGKTFDVEDGFLHKIRVAQFKSNLSRVVLDVDDVAEYSAFLLPNPYRLIIDIHGRKTAKARTPLGKAEAAVPKPDEPVTATSEQPEKTKVVLPEEKPATRPVETAKLEAPKIDERDKATSKPTSGPTFKTVAPQEKSRKKTNEQMAHVAAPTSQGERSLIRALGRKIGKIVIDAGHGGHDTGTIGPNGLNEKDLVLDVALKLGKLLETRLGAEVIYTRDDDTFIPLETRTAIANKQQADLFISIHANSSSDASARGVETYYLNFTSSADALEVAARENSVSEKSIHELQDLVKKIALKEKIEESREFAVDVEKSLYGGLGTKNPGLKDRGVKKAHC